MYKENKSKASKTVRENLKIYKNNKTPEKSRLLDKGKSRK